MEKPWKPQERDTVKPQSLSGYYKPWNAQVDGQMTINMTQAPRLAQVILVFQLSIEPNFQHYLQGY